jgi:hypothetical protein|tara:strand:- start:6510 stop:6752 length:243 start_codon:yes stop_codon:yes gene_type:complete
MNNLDELRTVQKRNNKEPEYCTVNNCNKFKHQGDILFCFTCRNDWIDGCIAKGIHEKIIPEFQLKGFLHFFQQNRFKNAP